MHCSFPCYVNERWGLDGWFGLSTESKNLLTFYYPCFDWLELYSERKSVSLRMYHVNLSQTINLGPSVQRLAGSSPKRLCLLKHFITSVVKCLRFSFVCFVSPGSFSFSILSGKIMFRDVVYVTKDLSFRLVKHLFFFRKYSHVFVKCLIVKSVLKFHIGWFELFWAAFCVVW